MDTIKTDIVYEIKVVKEIKPSYLLQLGMYVLMSKSEKGVIRNTRTNEMHEITIKDARKSLKTIKKERE